MRAARGTLGIAPCTLLVEPCTLKAFYSDTFELLLPEHHRFPMAKYRLLRERLVADGVLGTGDLYIPDPIPWDDLRLVHDAATGRTAPPQRRRVLQEHDVPRQHVGSSPGTSPNRPAGGFVFILSRCA